MKKRVIIAVLSGLLVFGGVFAMAASLGTISPDKVGSSNVVVAACDTDGVTTSYTSAWDATDKRYEISSVTVAGVADTCDGQTLKVSVADSTGAQLSEGSSSIPTSVATSFSVSLTTAASAESAGKVHVFIGT